MWKQPIVLALVALITLFSRAGQATVVYLDCDFDSSSPANYTYTWSFDYDLQELTIAETISEFVPGSWWVMGIGGRVDADSTFSVVRTLVNDTGITWTGYTLRPGPLPIHGGGAYILPESVQSTKLQTITHIPGLGIQFSEPPAVLDGESFTMQFDIYAPYSAAAYGIFQVRLHQNPIPEPSTIALLGLGGLALLRRHRRSKEL